MEEENLNKIDCSKFKVGDFDPNGRKISKIYYSAKEYLIYDIEGLKSINYLTEDVKCEANKIALEVEKINDVANINVRRKNKYRIASAFRDCFEGNVDRAKALLNSIYNSIVTQKVLKLKYWYLITSLLLVLLILL